MALKPTPNDTLVDKSIHSMIEKSIGMPPSNKPAYLFQ